MNHYNLIIKNFELQSQTIQIVVTIFAVFIAVVIFYAGWKTTRIENERAKIIEEKNKIIDEFINIKKELSINLKNVREIEDETVKIKNKVLEDKESLLNQIKNLVLNHAEEVLIDYKASKDAEDKNVEPNESEVIKKRIEEIQTSLNALESISANN